MLVATQGSRAYFADGELGRVHGDNDTMARWIKIRRYLWRRGSKLKVRLRFRLRGGGYKVLQETREGATLEWAEDKVVEFLALRKMIRKRSLTVSLDRYSTYGSLSDFLTERKPRKSMVHMYGELKREGGRKCNEDFPAWLDEWLQLKRSTPSVITGRPCTEATINRYISVAKTVYNYAVKMGAVTGVRENPLGAFERTKERGRTRVWTPEERRRIFAAMAEHGSYLYWPVYFCQWNPIRRGDLFSLTRDSLDRDGKRVHFYPSKTRGRVDRETFLPFIDAALWKYFDGLPRDCPYLFPKLLKGGGWRKVSDPDTHWHTVLGWTEVKGEGDDVAVRAVVDFHFHDLKHCAMSWMFSAGYTEVDIKELGIQYSHKMVMRYAHGSVDAIQARWAEAQRAVAGSIMPEAVALG